MNVEIDRAQPSPQFLHARKVAAATIQEQFKKLPGKLDGASDFRWMKSELTWPSYDHLTFSYGNRVFSVLVDAVSAGQSSITRQAMDRFLAAATENQLVPCVFPVNSETMSPHSPGWNLFDAVKLTPVDPKSFDMTQKIMMSDWELRNFVIQIVRDSITKDGSSKIRSLTDVLGVDPQIWFEDATGNLAWVIVRHCPQVTGNEWKAHTGLEKSNPQLLAYDGYFAAVSLASSAPVLYGPDGQIIPLSERFSGMAPIYRGDTFYINFKGLQRIYVG